MRLTTLHLSLSAACGLSLLILTIFCLSGCALSGLKDSTEPTLYLLETGTANEQVEHVSHSDKRTLMVSETSASRIFNSQKIVFQRDAETVSFYKLAQWADPPPLRFTSLLIESLERKSNFSKVSRMSTAASADLLLWCEILDFVHVTYTTPGHVEVTTRCELTDLTDRSLVSSARFHAKKEPPSYDAEGAVRAFNAATSDVMQQILVWLNKPA